MAELKLPGHIRAITVSGLHSNIGKTLLSEQLLGLVDGVAAVKMTTRDMRPSVTDNDEMIMVEGKDTFRLKNSGAVKVVWVTAREEDTLDAFQMGLGMLGNSTRILIEGNSILRYLTPDLSFFVCDELILDADRIKPSRKLAIKKADVIIYNLRGDAVDGSSDNLIREACQLQNPDAVYLKFDLSDSAAVKPILRKVLEAHSFLSGG